LCFGIHSLRCAPVFMRNARGLSAAPLGGNPRHKSNGQYALYHGDEEIHIATLEIRLFSQIEYPNQVQVNYSVVTDRTKIQYGVCRIKIRPENPTLETQRH